MDTETEPIKGKCSYETFDNNDSFNEKQKDRDNFNEKNNTNENQGNGKYGSYQKNKKQKINDQNDINSLFANSTKNNTNYGSDKSFDNLVQSRMILVWPMCVMKEQVKKR